MISFNLKCKLGHGFEGWFASSDDYEDQRKNGLVACPICGDTGVEKALMTPNVAAKSNATPVEAPEKIAVMPPPPAQQAKSAYAALRALQKKIQTECEHVGDNFPEEARRIHYGESEERGIYGHASDEDASALADEGIAIAAMPWLPPEN